MILNLEEPFKSMYRKGYIRDCPDGRKRVDMVNSSLDRTTIAFSRYKLSVELGYVIGSGYEVDHINGDCTDDSIWNLQILTVEEHRKKSSEEMSGRTYVELTCVCCGKDFVRELRQHKNSRAICSRSCNGKLFSLSKNGSREKVIERETLLRVRNSIIPKHKELGVKAYATKLGISPNTLRKKLSEL